MSEAECPRKVRILLIEDNAADIDLLRRALRAGGLDCELTIVDDGAEALALLRRIESAKEEPAPDLVILDLNLPKNDGIEVLAAMRAAERFAQAPVVVLSSSASPRERARIERFRVAGYITKPPDLDEFLRIGETLRELLTKADAQGAA